jgi:tRNA threonylcarbamoyladenosine biosynthesis protein TsaB
MGYILCIETATRICSVALGKDGVLLSARESFDDYAHSRLLTPFIQSVVHDAGISFEQLDAVAVSKGPGSFTGLRIGVSAAKGLCYALDIPLIAVGTLQSMAYGMAALEAAPPLNGKYLFCPMIDARRMEVYAALYDQALNEILAPVAEIINAESFAGYFKEHQIIFAGDGAEKCCEMFAQQSRALFRSWPLPLAQYMIAPSEQSLSGENFEDLAYFEPYYLKDFVAGKPRVKGLI